MSDENHPQRLSPVEASLFLLQEKGVRVAVATLAKYRSIGGGPLFAKFGARRVLYRPTDLLSWADEAIGKPRRNTGDLA
jgi:hypothetical protein